MIAWMLIQLIQEIFLLAHRSLNLSSHEGLCQIETFLFELSTYEHMTISKRRYSKTWRCRFSLPLSSQDNQNRFEFIQFVVLIDLVLFQGKTTWIEYAIRRRLEAKKQTILYWHMQGYIHLSDRGVSFSRDLSREMIMNRPDPFWCIIDSASSQDHFPQGVVGQWMDGIIPIYISLPNCEHWKGRSPVKNFACRHYESMDLWIERAQATIVERRTSIKPQISRRFEEDLSISAQPPGFACSLNLEGYCSSIVNATGKSTTQISRLKISLQRAIFEAFMYRKFREHLKISALPMSECRQWNAATDTIDYNHISTPQLANAQRETQAEQPQAIELDLRCKSMIYDDKAKVLV
ncbi:hypothetical protein CPB83DRAFT_915040 [Crepidotus variabilis]|uniref:Uncharacterized protein n=1 Tax=Crepidotus variabilis TaxID=179855 RepID=A0A9P6E5Z1_9AGAR|nr:hypothetical protein CPB83DRAFT_915040 [Crepidotus variabilis]